MKATLNATLVSRRTYRAFALLALCLGCFAAAYSWVSWQNSRADALRHATELVDVGEKSLNAYFSQIEIMLGLSSQDLLDERGRMDPVIVQSRLSRLKNAYPDLLNANIISLDGVIILSSVVDAKLPAPVGDVTSFNESVAEFSQGRRLSIGRPFVGPLSNEWIIPVRYAVRDASRNLRYVLTATLPLSRPQSFWKDAILPTRVALGLIQDDGYLLSRYPVPDALSLAEIYGRPRTGAMIKHLREKQFPVSGHVEGPSSLDGPDHLVVYRRLSNHPLTLFITQPISNVRAAWWSSVQVPYLLLFLLLAGGFVVFRRMLRTQDAWEAERNDAERTLREREAALARFKDTLDQTLDCIFMFRADTLRFTYVNEGAKRQVGYSETELMQMTPVDIKPDFTLEQFRQMAQPLIEGVQPSLTFQTVHRHKNGNDTPVEIFLQLIRPERQEPCFVAVVRDITARKQAEVQMARSVKELADFKAALDEHAIVATTDAGGTITYANDKFCAISKYAREELIGQNHRIINSEYHPQAFFSELWKTIASGGIWKGEIKNRAKDGTFYWVDTTIVPFLDEHLKPIQYIAIRADTTERKQAEQALIAARDAAEVANRAKDSFLATMSHEIRTPLGGLMGMLELLSLAQLGDEERETLQTARDSGQSLLRILNDILDWSKIEEGKLELAPQSTSIARLVAEVANTYSHVASGNSVTLTQYVDARLSPALVVDPLRLSQVLNNFVSNAVKFSRGGRVELRAELIERREGAEQVRFSVKDTGVGIDPEVQQRLFRRYDQGGADTARMYGGTGLGLAICRRLADLLDGRIDLQSAPGRGSTFSITLTLPIAETAAEPRQSPAAMVDAAATQPLIHGVAAVDAPAVLVVDDNPTNRRLLALQLGLLGLRSEAAENGEVALPLWRNGRYALVITDCHMPQMDGYALTRAIRGVEAVEARPRTPIFAWTANALGEEIENCRAAGMDELLVKPTDLAQLKQVLARWLPMAAEPVPERTAPVVPQPAAPLAVDVSVLTALVGDDAAVIHEFLQDFRVSAAAIAAEIRAACQAGDATAAGAAAHKLKSSARSVGALKLGEICDRMEQAGKGGENETLAALLLGFEQELTAVEAYLDSLSQARH